MTITPDLFAAYLKCPTKCWLRQTGEPASGNVYAEWVRDRDEAARVDGTKRLIAEATEGSVAHQPPTESLKTATWRQATDVVARTANTETRIAVVERVASEGRGKAAQFVPVRFVWRNKLHRDDKLLLAFDALALSETLGREVPTGRIVHGDNQATLKVKLPALVNVVRKLVEKAAALLSNSSPPDLVLNRHCAECEFQARCRKIAVEKDDLSLLATMNAKERQKLRSKGIFTVTQLSYTFRPRRRPKRQRDKREKYHHALKALAIREKKIHIVGSPELKIDGTPVYLDVEGLPDRNFYYLIGVRVGNGGAAVQHSLWADTVEEERRIWSEFLALLATVEKPVLIHYGSYETVFLRRMIERCGQLSAETALAETVKSAVNLVSFFFGQVYFPTLSNGLKEITKSMGFRWSDEMNSGLQAIVSRNEWEHIRVHSIRKKVIDYNVDDCKALALLAEAAARLSSDRNDDGKATEGSEIVSVDSLSLRETMWPRFKSPLTEFEQINKAARWDYQRDRVYVRSLKRIGTGAEPIRSGCMSAARVNKVVACPDQSICSNCGANGYRQYKVTSKVLFDLFFGKNSLKKRVIRYRFRYHWCSNCRTYFGMPKEFWQGHKFGRNLIAYVVYEVIELGVPQNTVRRCLSRLFGLDLVRSTIPVLKARAASFYKETRQKILERVQSGCLVHVDETRAIVEGKTAYVWVFTNLQEVVYLFSESREGEMMQATLSSFRGVLVSDFYSAYDSLACAQQKCLIHLMRDLNDQVLSQPFDEELKQIAVGFSKILKPMVETVDRFGLKKHFLRRHLKFVERFYRQIENPDFQSEAAKKCKDRFEKNRGKLFTFLEHDGVPWNNNNAEHAIKAFAALRDVMLGSSTQNGLDDYLILLSVCQTCKYRGVDFLDFLRAGEKDVHAFAEKYRRRKPAHQSTAPAMFLTGPATQAMGADESAI